MRRVATVMVTIVGVALAVLVPKIASAASAAVCHATNGTSSYEFNGGLATTGAGATFRVFEYGGVFDGIDAEDPDDIPLEAKNDFNISILEFQGHATVHSAHTPDNIPYGVPYVTRPSGWYLDPVVLHFARYVAAFDKREIEDAHCEADSPTFVGPPMPELQPISDLCEQVECDVLEG